MAGTWYSFCLLIGESSHIRSLFFVEKTKGSKALLLRVLLSCAKFS